MGFVDFLITIFECLIAIVALVLTFISFVFYFSTFVEEKMRNMKKVIQIITYIVLGLSLFLPISGFSWYICIITIATNVLWLMIQNSNFPFVPLTEPKLFIAFILTIFNHFFFMLHFLSDGASFFTVVSYFFLYVWFIPILILSSLCALDEDQVEQKIASDTQQQQETFSNTRRSSNKSVWNSVITRLLKKAETALPHSSSKMD